ncbi:MAG: CHRD domain-containing protein [Burkholderiaceae bacterium]|jgi:hypothetical protein|nr:CHRD domain-containing protein [Burkholderiaceae bacterium]
MKTFQYFISVVLKVAVAAGLTVFVLAGCATVDLEPDDDAPQVRMPGSGHAVSAPQVSVPEDAPQVQTMPVVPEGSVTQSVPPPGSAVGSVPAAETPAADAHLVTLTTHPDGAGAVPPTSSGATAQIDLVYDNGTRLLRWMAKWTNLSSPITAVNFYGPAAPGQQGPPTLIWPGPFGPHYEGRATLTPQQATDLMGGLWYVSIGTVNYPDGEIRGQVRVVY